MSIGKAGELTLEARPQLLQPRQLRHASAISRALVAIRARVKAVIGPRSQLSRSVADVVVNLNPVLRGWGNYFRWGNPGRKFVQIDSYVQERLALFDSKKRGRSGRGWGERHDAAWLRSLGVHRLCGTVRYGSPATATM